MVIFLDFEFSCHERYKDGWSRYRSEDGPEMNLCRLNLFVIFYVFLIAILTLWRFNGR